MKMRLEAKLLGSADADAIRFSVPGYRARLYELRFGAAPGAHPNPTRTLTLSARACSRCHRGFLRLGGLAAHSGKRTTWRVVVRACMHVSAQCLAPLAALFLQACRDAEDAAQREPGIHPGHRLADVS